MNLIIPGLLSRLSWPVQGQGVERTGDKDDDLIRDNSREREQYYNGGGLRSREMYENIGRALSELYDIKREAIRLGGEKVGDTEASGD